MAQRSLRDGDVIYKDEKGQLCCINTKEFDGWWNVGNEIVRRNINLPKTTYCTSCLENELWAGGLCKECAKALARKVLEGA